MPTTATTAESSATSTPHLHVVPSGPLARFASDLSIDERTYAVANSGKRGIDAKWWNQDLDQSFAELVGWFFSKHAEQEHKDGQAFFPGKLTSKDTGCTANNVEWIDQIGIDIDVTDEEQALGVIERLKDAGLGFAFYSTFTHLSTETESPDYRDWAAKHELPATAPETAQRYLSEVKRYRADAVQGARVKLLLAPSSRGAVTILEHGELIKLRIVLALDQPYKPIDMIERYGVSDKDARTRVWNAALKKLFDAAGVPFDVSCATDVSRRFYKAACKTGTPADDLIAGGNPGKCVKLESILPADVAELDALVPPKAGGQRKVHTKGAKAGNERAPRVEWDGRDLTRWKGKHGKTWDGETALRNSDAYKDERSEGGIYLQCPTDGHSDGPAQTFFENGDGERNFVFHCSGNTDDCCNKDPLERFAGLLDKGWLTIAHLEDTELGGGPVPLSNKPVTVEQFDEYIGTFNAKTSDADVAHAVSMLARIECDIARASAMERLKEAVPKRVKEKTLDEALANEQKHIAKDAKAAKAAFAEMFAQARHEKNSAVVLKLTDRFKWILDANGYWDTVAGTTRPKDAVHSDIRSDLQDIDSSMEPSEALLLNPDSKFARIGYRPKGPEVYEDGDGLRILNTYKPSKLEPMDGDASPMVEHVKYVFGKDQHDDPEAQSTDYDVADCNYFFDCMAFIVQNEDKRPLTASLLASMPGVGKGAIARALKPIVGDHNYVEPTHKEIGEGKNAYLERKRLAIVHEVYDVDNKREIASVMKPLITESTVRVRKMYLDHYSIENAAWWLMFTNHYNALFVENGDRRYFLYHSRAKPRDEAYYKALYDWLDGDGPAIFYAWLLRRDVSGFNPTAPAPMTDAKRDAIEASMGETALDLSERFRDGFAPFNRDLLTLKDALAYLKGHCDLGKLSRAALVKFIREQGGMPLSDQPTYFKPPHGVGCERRLWVLRNGDKWRNATAEQIGVELFRPILTKNEG